MSDDRNSEMEVPELPKVTLGPHFEMHPVVFPAGAVIVLALVALTIVFPADDVQSTFVAARDWIGSRFGWLYVASMTGFLGFAIWLAVGRFGHVKLGRDDEKPEFGRLTWFAMLFSAGMGIGLVFWSVAEPIYHFNDTPPGFADGLDPARVAMAVTIFHWGLHPWALYAVVALALAYFGFRRGMPLGFRSLLHPLLGDRVWGPTGDAIDTLAIIATLTGVATSLGLGAQQVNAGLAFLFDVPIDRTIQILLIAGITAIATVSVVLGLGTGIRRLSEANMVLAGILMVIVIFGGGLVAFLGSAVENTGAYLQLLPFSSFRTGATSVQGRTWLNGWTVFYWAWWISWSPFVGMFIARVSRGRTIREFVIGVLLVPTAVGIVWLTAFGSTALRQHTRHLAASDAYNAAVVDAAEDGDMVDAIDPDEALPVYEVQARSAGGAFAIAEDGTLVGLAYGGVYERDEDGTLRTVANGVPVEVDDGQIVTLEGHPFVPSPQNTFEGSFAATEKPMTAVEYLGAPVLDGSHATTIATLPTVLYALLDGALGPRWLVLTAVGVATLCIVLFFVTSSDSASMVIDIIASGGNPDPPVGTRLFWALAEGVVAAVLLLAGGLDALQAAAIAAALPFTLILILACVSLVRGLAMYEGRRPGA